MRRALWVVGVAMVMAGAAGAQVPPAAPAAGTGGGGPVGASVGTPRAATGKTPPGTPTAQTEPGRVARDQVGQEVIGKTKGSPHPVVSTPR